jgi:hypothetical protein
LSIKRARKNKVADSLSKVFEELAVPMTATCSLISFPSPTLLEELMLIYDSYPDTIDLLHKLQLGEDVPKSYMLKNGLILKKGKIFIVKNSPFKGKILDYIHNNPQVGHSGYRKTVQNAKADFHWEDMRNDIKRMVRECHVCQVSKGRMFFHLDYYNLYPFLKAIGLIFQWILLRACPFLKGRV